MQLKRPSKQIAKEILGSNLVFTASILVIVIAAAMTGVLIELLNPQSYYHSYRRLPSKFTQGIGELASQILQFAGPIWLLLGLPCYLLIPYPSKFWEPKNSMAVGVAIGTVGTTIDWLGMSLINNDFSWLQPAWFPAAALSLAILLLSGIIIGATTGLVSALTAKWFKTF
jgi:hypothetical protein